MITVSALILSTYHASQPASEYWGISFHLVQGWSSIFPHFSLVDFASFYIELLTMTAMTAMWFFLHPSRSTSPRSLAHTTSYEPSEVVGSPQLQSPSYTIADLVNIDTLDLYVDEYEEDEEDRRDDEIRQMRLETQRPSRWMWRMWYLLA